MGLFGKRKNINDYIEEARKTPGSLVADVRQPLEYQAGHIPGSVNIPLTDVPYAMDRFGSDPDRPIYLYCLTGPRAQQAAAMLRQMGYGQVQAIGGIRQWKGAIEK